MKTRKIATQIACQMCIRWRCEWIMDKLHVFKLAKTARLMNCIRGPDYPNWGFRNFPQSLQANAGTLTLGHSYFLSFTSFPIHCHEGTRRYTVWITDRIVTLIIQEWRNETLPQKCDISYNPRWHTLLQSLISNLGSFVKDLLCQLCWRGSPRNGVGDSYLLSQWQWLTAKGR